VSLTVSCEVKRQRHVAAAAAAAAASVATGDADSEIQILPWMMWRTRHAYLLSRR